MVLAILPCPTLTNHSRSTLRQIRTTSNKRNSPPRCCLSVLSRAASLLCWAFHCENESRMLRVWAATDNISCSVRWNVAREHRLQFTHCEPDFVFVTTSKNLVLSRPFRVQSYASIYLRRAVESLYYSTSGHRNLDNTFHPASVTAHGFLDLFATLLRAGSLIWCLRPSPPPQPMAEDFHEPILFPHTLKAYALRGLCRAPKEQPCERRQHCCRWRLYVVLPLVAAWRLP